MRNDEKKTKMTTKSSRESSLVKAFHILVQHLELAMRQRWDARNVEYYDFFASTELYSTAIENLGAEFPQVPVQDLKGPKPLGGWNTGGAGHIF